MGKYMKATNGKWVRNPYEHVNPWIRLMVTREPELYHLVYKRGYCLGHSPVHESTFHTCPHCGQNDAWYRPTVGAVICHSCGAIGDAYGIEKGNYIKPSGTRCTYEGRLCPKPPNSCGSCEWLVHQS